MQLSKKVLTQIEREADRRTIQSYIGRGVFGGTSTVKGGFVTGRSYFPYAQVKARHIEEIKTEYARTQSVRTLH